MKRQFNQKYYEDILNYSTSIKDNNYSLTYFEATVLRKLIHINFTDEVIKYSNANLAKMLFRPNGENNVKNTISKLIKKGFITTANITISDGNSITKRRTIKINWDMMETIYKSLPNFFEKEDKSDVIEVNEVSVPEKRESASEELKISKEEGIEKYNRTDVVDVYEYLPTLGFTNNDIFKIRDRLNNDNVMINDIIGVIGGYIKEMKYNYYNGPVITNEIKNNIKLSVI